jgi:hypothetical protein
MVSSFLLIEYPLRNKWQVMYTSYEGAVSVCVQFYTVSLRSILTAKFLIYLYHSPLGFLRNASHVIPNMRLEFLLHLHSVDTIILYGFPIERKYAPFYSPFNLTNGADTHFFTSRRIQ